MSYTCRTGIESMEEAEGGGPFPPAANKDGSGRLRALSAVVAAAAALVPAVAAAQDPPGTSCPDWDKATQIWESPAEVGMLQPAEALSLLTVDTGRALVVAAFRGVLPGDTSHDLVITYPGQNPLPNPPGGRFFLGPEAVLDAHGALHLLWGEPEQTVGEKIFDYTGPSTIRLLYSRYRSGSWTQAEEIAEVHDWTSYLGSRSELIADGRGNLHYVFADSGGSKLKHLQMVAGRWSVDDVPDIPEAGFPGLAVGGGGAYPTLLQVGDDELLLAQVAGAAEPNVRRRHDNSVFIRRSTDAGESWGDPVLVYLSNGQPAMRLQMVQAPGGGLHLFWVTPQRARTPVAGGILHSASNDGGASWSEPRPVPLPEDDEGPGVIRAVAAPDGAVHLMFTSSRRPHRQLWRSTVVHGHISKPMRVLPDTTRRVSNFEFALDPGGRTHLLWASAERYRESDPPGFRDLRLLYASRSPCLGDR